MAETVLLVGCGKMGGALLAGWLERGVAAADVEVVEPDADGAARARALGVAAHASLGEVDPGFSPRVVVFAVKPQAMAGVVPPYARFAGPACLFLSIAAGCAVGFFEARLGAETAIVRAMPNTPAAIGRGISVLCANARAHDAERALAERLMGAVGEVAWVEDEALMDAVTAVSGSGPAYVFLLAECLARAGAAAGLPADLAARLADATVAGAGELLRVSDEDAAVLRANVTSPGGTTEAALGVLMAEPGLGDLLVAAVAAATARSRELGE